MSQELSEIMDSNVIDQIFGKEEAKEDKVEIADEVQKTEETIPEPKEEATPESEGKEQLVTKKETPESNKVDYGALKQERLRRKELENQLKEFQAKLARYEQQPQPTAPQPVLNEDGEITFEKNPQEALRQATLLMYQELNSLKSSWEDRQKQEEANRQVTSLVNQYRTTATDYVKSNPDYTEAYNHLYKIKTAEFELMGLTPKQADAEFIKWEMRVGYDAYENEANPHEVLHELARRVGYTPAASVGQPGQESSKLSIIKQGLQDNKNLTPSKALTPEKDSGNLIEDFLPSARKKRG